MPTSQLIIRKCFIFTNAFPYGQAEAFLETEVLYLAKHFSKVIIIPYKQNSPNQRELPDNCMVMDPVMKNKTKQVLTSIHHTKALFLKELLTSGVIKSKKRIQNWITDLLLTNVYLASRPVKTIKRTIKPNDVLYFYWGRDACNIIPFISLPDVFKMIRFHGSDLWENLSDNYIPIRKRVLDKTDLTLFVSKAGMDYLKSLYPNINALLSRLGTKDHGLARRSQDGIYRIVSCSYLVPVKRVGLILEVLNHLKEITIEWTHIGDGPELEQLKEAVKGCRYPVHLTGNINQKELVSYYQTHEVDLFINLSSSEGIPVTIMEAISYNIPVVATNVGGVSEIVNQETGILVSANPGIEEVVTAIYKAKSTSFSPRKFWEVNYESDKNYTEFFNRLELIINSRIQ